MPLITFTSDFGLSDHYVAKTKALVLKANPKVEIFDISHNIRPFDVSHMGYVLHSIYQDFPNGTIHLIGSADTTFQQNEYIFAELEDHIFIGPNNGVLSLIDDRPPKVVVKLVTPNGFMSLPAIAGQIAAGEKPENFGEPLAEHKMFMQRKARATRKEISGHVIRVDHYGNLITNIEKTDFDILSRDRKYTITFGRERINTVHDFITQVEPGDVFFVFNSNERLTLGINQGNGSQLLGLEFDSPIHIAFEE